MNNKLFHNIILLFFSLAGLKLYSTDANGILLRGFQVGTQSQIGTAHRQTQTGMEDAVLAVPLSNYLSDNNCQKTDALFGIFDGHGGSKISHMLATQLAPLLAGKLSACQIIPSPDHIGEMLLDSIAMLERYSKSVATKQGSTATIALIYNNHLHVANVGDSRTVVFLHLLGDEKGQTRPTTDHKPDDREEEQRIEKENSFISHKVRGRGESKRTIHRVFGILSLSRSIGDFWPKETLAKIALSQKQTLFSTNEDLVKIPGLSAKPDYRRYDLDPSIKFFILASDGIWDVVESTYATKISQRTFQMGGSSLFVAQKLVDIAVQNESRDDLSAVVVKLIWPDSHQ